MLKNPIFMFLVTSIFLFHIQKNTSCSFKYFQSSDVIVVKKKSLSKFTSFRYSYVQTYIKNNKIMVADKNSNLITLVTKIILLLQLLRHI